MSSTNHFFAACLVLSLCASPLFSTAIAQNAEALPQTPAAASDELPPPPPRASTEESEPATSDDTDKNVTTETKEEAEAKAKKQFEEAVAAFHANDFTSAKAALVDLTARADLPNAHGYLALTLSELGQHREAELHATVGFFQMSPSMRANLAQKFKPVAEEMERFEDVAIFTAELAHTAKAIDERNLHLETLTRLTLTQLDEAALTRLITVVPKDNNAWPILKFRQVILQVAALNEAKATANALNDGIILNAEGGASAQVANVLPAAQPKATEDKQAYRVDSNVVGVILPMTGKYGAFGKMVKTGLDLALKHSDVRLVFKDTAGDPMTAQKAVLSLVKEEGAIAIVGPVLSTEAPYVVTEADRLGVPLIALASNEGLPDYGKWIFRTMLTRSAQAKALADYAMGRLGYRKFGVFYPEFAYGTELAGAFWDEVERRGGQMNAAESYPLEQTTFRDQARKLVGRYYLEEREEFVKGRKEIREMKVSDFKKRKLQENLLKKLPPIIDFEALFIPDNYQRVSLVTPALAVEDIITNACDKHDVERIAETTGTTSKEIKTVLLLGSDGWNFPELVERGGKFVQCAVFVDAFYADAPLEETKLFVRDWTAVMKGRVPPMLIGAVSYDTGNILKDILQRAEPPATRGQMRDELLKVKEFPGACGATSFKPNGEIDRPLFLLTIDKKGIHEVE